MAAPTTFRDAYDRVQVNGAELAYVDIGTRDPVVFVHGGLSDLTYLEPFAAMFAAESRAITYSRRYAWPNQPLPKGAADPIDPHVQDLADVLNTLRATPAHVAGHSWGASICLLFAAKHPELVRTLTLIEPEVFGLFTGSPPSMAVILRLFAKRPGTAITVVRAAMGGQPIRAAYKRGEDQEAIRLALNWANGYDFYGEMDPAVRTHLLENVAFSKAGTLAGPVKVSAEDARRIIRPTLLVVGERSPKFFHVFIAELKGLIKGAEVHVIPNASHGMFSQNPQAVAEAIRAFISSPSANRPA